MDADREPGRTRAEGSIKKDEDGDGELEKFELDPMFLDDPQHLNPVLAGYLNKIVGVLI